MRPAGNDLRKVLQLGDACCFSILCFCLVISLLAFSASAHAQGPHGDFVCQQYAVWYATDAFTNVATIHLGNDGSYSAKDLTAQMPDVHGKFVYDAKAKTVTWDAGIWATLLGHYVPSVSGTSLLLVTTRKDPEGKVNGTLRCLKVDPKLLK